MTRNVRAGTALAAVMILAAPVLWAGGRGEGGVPEGPAEIVAWLRGGPGGVEWFERNAQEYMEAHPQVTLRMEHQGGSHSDYGAKLRLSFRSGTGPDIIHEPHDVNLTSLMSAGFTAPAPDYIVEIIEQETIAQNALLFQHLDGDPEKPIHAALITWQCQQYLYNRDYLMEAGLPERGAVDRDEFRDWARKLTVRDANGNMVRAGYTFKMPNPHWHMSPWVFGAGGTYLTADQSAAAVTTPEGRAAWERAMQYIYDITWEDGSGDFGAGNPRELFWNGDVAIHAEGIYEIAHLHRNAPELDYILDNIPKDRYSSPVCAVGGISVSSKSKNPEVAWDFLRFSLQPERHKTLFDPKSESQLSPYRSTAELVALDHPAWQTFLKQPNRRLRMQGLGANEAWQEVGRAVEAYLSQSKTLDQSLDDLAAAFDKIMEDRPIRELPITYEE